MPRGRCSSTGGREISDDLYDGYLVSSDGKIVGEARGYDPFSKFGHIMLYEIDSFGFIPGFVSRGLRLMSEEDLKADPRLRQKFEESQYQVWKRKNILELREMYESKSAEERDKFDKFCKTIYEKMKGKE